MISMSINGVRNPHERFDQVKAYQSHLKKLSQIHSNRKYNSISHVHSQIRNQKHATFIHKFNGQLDKIGESNLKLFARLQRESTAPQRYSVQTSRSVIRKQTPTYIQEYRTISHENDRIKKRIKSATSSVSTSNLLEKERKRQEIKNRLLKFKPNNREKAASFYRPEDIMKNKVDRPVKINRISFYKNTGSERKNRGNSFFTTSHC